MTTGGPHPAVRSTSADDRHDPPTREFRLTGVNLAGRKAAERGRGIWTFDRGFDRGFDRALIGH
jgi:hypothetical protein